MCIFHVLSEYSAEFRVSCFRRAESNAADSIVENFVKRQSKVHSAESSQSAAERMTRYQNFRRVVFCKIEERFRKEFFANSLKGCEMKSLNEIYEMSRLS